MLNPIGTRLWLWLGVTSVGRLCGDELARCPDIEVLVNSRLRRGLPDVADRGHGYGDYNGEWNHSRSRRCTICYISPRFRSATTVNGS